MPVLISDDFIALKLWGAKHIELDTVSYNVGKSMLLRYTTWLPCLT